MVRGGCRVHMLLGNTSSSSVVLLDPHLLHLFQNLHALQNLALYSMIEMICSVHNVFLLILLLFCLVKRIFRVVFLLLDGSKEKRMLCSVQIINPTEELWCYSGLYKIKLTWIYMCDWRQMCWSYTRATPGKPYLNNYKNSAVPLPLCLNAASNPVNLPHHFFMHQQFCWFPFPSVMFSRKVKKRWGVNQGKRE